MPQLKINLKQPQYDAISRVAAERGVSKATLLRETIADVTGVEPGFRRTPWVPGLQGQQIGWANRSNDNNERER